MTQLLFDKKHFFDCSPITRDIAATFYQRIQGQEFSLAIKPGVAPFKARIHLYGGKYNGLNRSICYFDVDSSPESIMADIVERGKFIELGFGEPSDYFGLKRDRFLIIREPQKEVAYSMQAG